MTVCGQNKAPNKVRLVIWDMDGVIFEGANFWLDLHKRYGTAEWALKSADRYLRSNYHFLAQLTAEHVWKGREAKPLFDLVRERQYQPGVHRVFSFLNSTGIRTAIVTSGPYQLAERAQKELGIDLIRANRLKIEGGVLTGSLELMVDDSAKDSAALEVMRELDTSPEETVVVGESEADIPMARVAGFAVAYNTHSDRLREACNVALEYGEMVRLIDVLSALQRQNDDPRANSPTRES